MPDASGPAHSPSAAPAETRPSVSTPPPRAGVALNPRTRAMIEAPILPLLLRMAWPNMLVMLAQASTGLIETWWISRLGTDALAGMALVFPPVMLMQMISNGAMGGGISSAVARALGGGRHDDANALVRHALVVNLVLGVFFAVVMLCFGRPFYRMLGAEGGALEAALTYSNWVFAGMPLLWIMAALASLLRGTGNMMVPALVTCGGVVLLVPLSPLLIFGLGPLPAMGVAGAGAAMVLYFLLSALVLAWYILDGRSILRLAAGALYWPPFRDILRVGAIGSITSMQTNLVIGLATALVAAHAGADAVAGFGTGARLEYLLIPFVFGLGAPLVAMVGTNIGAGHYDRAMRIAAIGAAIAFAMTETIGLAAAIFPEAWVRLFSDDPRALEAGVHYLRWVGPTYGFFGMGLLLYFASQGAGRLFWPITCGFIRLAIAAGGGWVALQLTGSLTALYVALALALLVYGSLLASLILSGAWFRGRSALPRPLPRPLAAAAAAPQAGRS